MARLPLPLHSYRLRSQAASPARLVNCFSTRLPENAKAPYVLTRTPGIGAWTTVGDGPIRASHVAFGYLWVVSGAELWRVATNKSATLIGTVGLSRRCDIDSNATTVVVVSQPNAYYYDTTSATFGQITDVDFTSRGAGDVEFVSDFLLFREPDSGRFFGADVGSATSFDGLNFATAEGAPDNLVGLIADHLQALLPGEKTVEIWELIGGSGFPWGRTANGVIELGCANGATLAKLDNSVFWLASDLTVRRLDGVTPVRVSHDGIDQALSSVTVDSGYAFSYSLEGQMHYVLTFPEGTFVYNATVKEWHELQSYGYSYWLPSVQASFAGLQLVGDSSSNRIGYLSPIIFQDWGGIQRMEWTYQPVYGEGKRVFHDQLQIICKAGVGLLSGQGSDPQMMMEISDEDAPFEALPSQSMGRMGKTGTLVEWSQLGSAFNRVYRGSISDPVESVIMDTQLTARGARA